MEKFRIAKFGGSNLSSASDVRRIYQVLQSYDAPVIVVVSAFKGTTDQLDGVLKYASNLYNEGRKFIHSTRTFNAELIDDLIEHPQYRVELKMQLEKRLNRLEKSLLAAHCLGEVPDFLRDEILSYGERFSSLIIAGYLKDKGTDFEEQLPEELPLLTDGVYGNATVDCDLTTISLGNQLDGRSVVVPGFYGVSRQGKITLLGRGGSDYSAACLAKCLNASSLDIWKDVNGFLSADPVVVENVSDIKYLSYDEASELAYFGSEILHPRIAEPLRASCIPAKIFNIKKYSKWPEPQTLITDQKHIAPEVVKGISYSDDFALVRLSGAGVGVKPGLLADITQVLDNENINIKSVLTSQIAINLLLEETEVDKASKLLKSANLHFVEEISMVRDISVIAAVGEGLVHFDGLASGMFTAVAEQGINVEMICFGASSVAVYFVVRKNRRLDTVKSIHDHFFNKVQSINQEAKG